jgi:phosphohistidine phosphatase SixA
MKLFPPAALLLAGLAACATTRAAAPTGPSYYVMRHLQKAEGADPGLSEEGRANAELLAGWFGEDRPSAIYVSATRRAQETAAPVAARLGVTPKVYDPADTPGLVARVLAETGTVLVIGHTNTVPEIVERLGGVRPPPIPESEFGAIWHVSGTPRRTEWRMLGGV